MNQHLTLLQRGVIQRLRDGGFPDFAATAKQKWSTGQVCDFIEIGGVSTHLNFANGIVNAELRADFERANHQIGGK